MFLDAALLVGAKAKAVKRADSLGFQGGCSQARVNTKSTISCFVAATSCRCLECPCLCFDFLVKECSQQDALNA